MKLKKIIVFILTITLLSSISFAERAIDSAIGVDFQLYLMDEDGAEGYGYLGGIGNNSEGQLGISDSESETLADVSSDVLPPEVGNSIRKRTITAGAAFSVIIKSDDKAYATGENYFGQLGDGTYESRNGFEAMSGAYNDNIASISAGADFVLLLNYEGAVYGVGDNSFGQIVANGDMTYSNLTPVYLPADNGGRKVIAIATGARHSILLLEDNSVLTLGANEYYQRNIVAPEGRKIVEIAAGSYHTLVRLDDNTVWGVGNNEDQQLAAHIGRGDLLDKYRSTMVQLIDEEGREIKVPNPDSRVRNIDAGFDFSIIVNTDKDGQVILTGLGNKSKNQLGREAVTKSNHAVKVETIDTIKNISANWLHTVIMGYDKNMRATESKGSKIYGKIGDFNEPIKEDFTSTVAMGAGHSLYVKDNILYGAGANSYGQLGIENYSSSVRKIPFNVEAVGGIKQIVTGASHSVILGFDGSVWVTGYNYSGQLGLGDNDDRRSFTRLNYNFDSQVISVAAGGDVTMILTQNGTAYAMGDNAYGQINEDANAPKSYNTPTIYSQNEKVIEIAAGVRHTMILKSDATVGVRGYDLIGASITKRVISIAYGAYHSLVLYQDGTVLAFGKNDYGQLGINSDATGYTGNTVVFDSGIIVKKIAAGYAHSVFLVYDENANRDKIYIAGSINGETKQIKPVEYADVLEPKEIATGWLGNIVKTANSILTIGNNIYGQRGSHRGQELDTYDDEIVNLSRKKIAAGDGYTLVLHSDGTLWGIGKNDVGQLGTGDNNDKSKFIKIDTPVAVGDIVDIQAGADYTLLLTREGELYGTGYNIYGLLGDEVTVTSVNRFTKIDINNIKKIYVNESRAGIIVLKNDDTLWEIFNNNDGFLNISMELNEGEYIKNVFTIGANAKVLVSDNSTDTDDRVIFTEESEYSVEDEAEIKEAEKIITCYRGGATTLFHVKLNDGDVFVKGRNNYGQLGIGSFSNASPDFIEVKMVTTEGTNNIGSVNAAESYKTFTEDIEDVAVATDHIVLVTKSGQLYASGSNENGLLGNEVLNDRNIEKSEVFVPMYIQSIVPTVGGVVK